LKSAGDTSDHCSRNARGWAIGSERRHIRLVGLCSTDRPCGAVWRLSQRLLGSTALVIVAVWQRSSAVFPFTGSSWTAEDDTRANKKPAAAGGDMCTEATLLESELRLRVQRRVEDGRLPVLLVSHLDASYGSGNVCCVCDQPITCDDVEYDIVDSRNTNCLSFHFSCHVIWQRECAHRAAHVNCAKPNVEGMKHDRVA
jgi:hypothetical protein